MSQRTLALIKPDAVEAKNSGPIIKRIEDEGFNIIALKKARLSEKEAKRFYQVHKDKNFYQDLVDFMISGPLLALVLEKKDAISEWRKLMGATDYQKAEEGSIRREFATSLEKNAVHGSDAEKTAEEEISFFFSLRELV